MRRLLAVLIIWFFGLFACLAQPLSGHSSPDPYQLNDTGLPVTGFQAPNRDTNAKTLGTQTINTGVQNCVFIAAGQSNITNTAPSAFTPVNGSSIDMLNIYDGAIYVAKDPLLGTGGVNNAPPAGGHPILRLADALVTAGKCARVIIVPNAVGSTSIAMWDSGSLSARLSVTMARLKAKLSLSGASCGGTGVICVILWGQGETDCLNGTGQSAYQTSFGNIKAAAAAAEFVGRWLVAKQTWQGSAVCAALQAAQAAVVDNSTVWAGANADALTGSVCNGVNACRQGDNLHWSDSGSIAYATDATNGWQAALHASGLPF